ncbi:glycosyltransferase family 2 protein [Tenacibaculum finnmarkense]|uniref:glycosyltransferase family 2 protein n=1 Tax=Tenacibaculum finnmarkense TaxID=2781243 RepID=UPI000C56A6D9|nr:glycosyltransferase family 2 protein [Tenacibaculum finnmarkense]MCG8769881.1 glycosyltransferase family 2 protein [Tenacibaculum finnmarkense]MCG8776499.1 glycosyltransferase family 2 protein [Tenacibaculum finnmarkense]MCG8871940.1 glycosyltransferase family 2 protein [Tenacibaculum finnmarkense]SOS51389.1 Glycosyl transferase family 2 [Tenacibaculum finnmarkense]
MNVSGLVITFNEEVNIKDCILSLKKVCNEVIIIDSFSTDKTIEIAESMGAKVYSQKFLGDGLQRVHGLQFCKNDWILNLDADERLDEDSYQFIKSQKYLKQPYDAYNFRRKNFLKKQPINFAGWYPSYTCRFFNKQTAKPATTKVHQSIQATNLKKTNLHLLHYGWKDFHQIIGKYNLYTTWQAEEYFEQGRKVHFFTPITHGVWSFIRCYILKKGILHGLDGITFSMLQAFSSYIKYAKLRKLYEESKL